MSSLIIISAPSGTGKTSIVSALTESDSQLSLSVSHTTRRPRPNEVEGQDYYFVDRDIFQAMVNRGEFLESAEVYGNLYGTSHKWVKECLASGRDILMEIDYQERNKYAKHFLKQLVFLFYPHPIRSLKNV